MIRQALRRTAKWLLYNIGPAEPLRVWWMQRRGAALVEQWVARGQPAPPPHRHKQEVLRQYASAYRLRILVETGTQHGHMLAVLRKDFSRLYSVELDPVCYEKARRRFRSDHHIELFCGDSADLLPEILVRLHEPALFWLDGHYNPNQAPSGEHVSPILAELAHLLTAPRLGHVIIIDDARLFNVRYGYPPLSEVLSMIERDGGWNVLIQDDSLRLTPRPHGQTRLSAEQSGPSHE